MGDRYNRHDWDLRGAVWTLRLDTSEWDQQSQAWLPPTWRQFITFDRAGRVTALETTARDGVIAGETRHYEDGRLVEVRFTRDGHPAGRTRHVVDDRQRPVRTVFSDDAGRERVIETFSHDAFGRRTGTSFAEAVPDAGGAAWPTTLTTTFDEAGRAVERVSHDAQHRPTRRTAVEYDREGRLVREETFVDVLAAPDMAAHLERSTPEERAQAVAMLQQALGPGQRFHLRTLAYDAAGRLSETRQEMGQVMESRTTCVYNDAGDVVEEVAESTHRELHPLEDGRMEPRNETAQRHITRSVYRYDDHGNWTERVISTRVHPSGEATPSARECRALTYYR
jgi:hypothetical protein